MLVWGALPVVTYTSPVLVGPKMESEEYEIESSCRTVISVDLSRHGPHGESADPKPSAASSEEEKLAACILLIGLQIKRLSGAQQRKLNRQKNKKEGTCMERKPRKAPTSGERSEAGSSGGVRRPH
jgi:hypothetical protein